MISFSKVQVRTMLYGVLNLAASIEPVSAALDLIAGTAGAARK